MRYVTITSGYPRDLWAVAAIFVLTLIAAGFTWSSLLSGYSPWQTLTAFRAPSDHQLQRMGEPIIVALEQHYSKHGEYPATLAEAGMCPPTTFFGPWRYEAMGDRGSCQLTVADYNRYNFVISWTPDTRGQGGWYSDH